ncbi:MAG: threonine--tRNA ligase [archaeon]
MKLLCIHSDFIEYEAKKKAIKNPEELKKKKDRMEDCLAVFTAVETGDETNPKEAVKLAVAEIEKNLKQVKTKKIMLYPYAHLSSDLGKPTVAVKIMEDMEKAIKKNYTIKRAPFGWYKSFNISCKGHPLSELSSTIIVGEQKTKEVVSKALKDEEKLKSHWYIMDEKGKLHTIDKFNFKDHKKLKTFSHYEKDKDRTASVEPAHIAIMKKLELVDYEPGSDSGNLRFYPKGRLVKKLMEEFVNDKVGAYGGLEVETPIMYDMKHPTLERYLNKFPARQYQIESDKKNYFLRFAACFGQFLIAKDAVISHKNLPLKLYELTRYSFRREQSGELSGLRRLRAFTMPDVHALCANMNQAKEEYKTRLDLCMDVQKGLGFSMDDLEIGLRITKEFYEKNKDLVKHIIKKIGKPILVEMWDDRKFYFILKYEFNFIDSVNKAAALATDQIDVENGERYGILFTDKDSKHKNPIILHCSPSGAIERVMYAMLEKQAEKIQKGETASIPLWLSPTQVRIIPVANNKHLKASMKICDELQKNNLRVDVDDRDETLGKKIRAASMEWTPYIIVVGDKEMKTGKLETRVRGKKDTKVFTKESLAKEIHKLTKGFPYKPLPLPKELSKRPIFSSFK